MIRFFHRFKRSFVVGLIIALVCLVMTGFGVDFMTGRDRDRHAIKVDETTISHSDFYEQKRAVERSYRRNLGELYNQLEESLTARLNEQLVDRMVADALLENFASSHELFSGDSELKRAIAGIFGGRFSMAAYDAFLRDSGMTATVFEQKLAKDLLKEQLTGALADVSMASASEARAAFERDETTFAINYLEIKPSALASSIADPGDEVLRGIYDERVTEMELPARAGYDYIVFNPGDFISRITIQPEDVEFYYSDNEKEFMKPEELKAKHILINIPAGSDEAKKKELKAKAEDLLKRIRDGEALEALAAQYSDDKASSVIGGDLGWLTRGRMSKEFDRVVFKMKGPGLSELIEATSSLEIVRVDDFREAAPKPLDEVRASIEAELKSREAPAYAATHAQETLEAWRKSGKPLAEYASASNLTVKSSPSLLDASKDPEDGVKGLSKAVLDSPDEKVQLVELGERYALVEIKEYKEPEPPLFAEVRGRLLEIYRQNESAKLARNRAEGLLAELKEGKIRSLDEASNSAGLKTQKLSDLKRSKNPEGIMSDEKIRLAVFTANQSGKVTQEIFSYNGNPLLLEVSSIKQPDMSSFSSREKEYKKRASSEMTNILVSSLINQLKARAAIDVAPDLLTADRG